LQQLATTSTAAFGAIAHNSEAPVNTPAPSVKIRRRP